MPTHLSISASIRGKARRHGSARRTRELAELEPRLNILAGIVGRARASAFPSRCVNGNSEPMQRVSIRMAALVTTLSWCGAAQALATAGGAPSAQGVSSLARSPSMLELKRVAQGVTNARATALASLEKAAAEAAAVTPLATNHKRLTSALTAERAELGKHLRRAQAAHPLRTAPAPKAKPGAALPKLDLLKTAKLEYETVLHESADEKKIAAELRNNDDELARHVESTSDWAASAHDAATEAQGGAALLSSEAKKASNDVARKEAAQLARAQATEALAAAKSALTNASTARTASGIASKAAYLTRKSAEAQDDEKAQQRLAAVRLTVLEVTKALAQQNPVIPACDLSKVPWQDMAYPWLELESSGEPVTFHAGVRVCDQPNSDECSQATPSLGDLVFGDLDGDGKPEAALHVMTQCCDVSVVTVLFFTRDAQCHLQQLGSVELVNSTGTIVGGAFVADVPFARHGENIGLGAVTGREHAEWRWLKGQLRKTVSVKTVVPLN